jgi:hypothetical protein
MKYVLFVLVGALMATSAYAQVTYVNPTPNGGYIVNRPGGPTTYVNPTPNDGYIANTPGYGTSYGNPTPNGGIS